jgi:hypothetical protein
MQSPEEKQAEYAKQRRIRMGYLDNHVRDRFLRELDKGAWMKGSALTWTVCWMPPLQMKDIGHWSQCDPATKQTDIQKMTYQLDQAGPCWFVTCEGYLVDKWWKEDHRDLSHMGR